MAYKDNHNIFGDNFDEILLKALQDHAGNLQSSQTDKTFNDTVQKIQKIGDTAEQTSKKIDEIGGSVEKIDGKKATVKIGAEAEPSSANQVTLSPNNALDKFLIAQKKSILKTVYAQYDREFKQAQSDNKLEQQMDAIAKIVMTEKSKSSNLQLDNEQFKKEIIKEILANADIKKMSGGVDLQSVVNRHYYSGDGFSGLKRIFGDFSADIRACINEISSGTKDSIGKLNDVMSKYSQGEKSLENAISILKLRNQVLRKDSKYHFSEEQEKAFRDIYNSKDVEAFRMGNKISTSDEKDIMLSSEKSISEKMDQFVKMARQFSSIASTLDKSLDNSKNPEALGTQKQSAFRNMVGTNQLDNLVRAMKDVITDGSNSDIIDQNRSDINNLLDFLTKSATTRSDTIKSTAKELLEYVKQIPSAQDNISVVKTGEIKSSGSQDSDVGTSSDADKQQKQLNRDKKEIEDKLIKPLSKVNNVDDFVQAYKQASTAIANYNQKVDEFTQVFNREQEKIDGYPEITDETKFAETLSEIFDNIQKYNASVGTATKSYSDPIKAQAAANDMIQKFKAMDASISRFEQDFNTLFRQDVLIANSTDKGSNLKGGYTQAISNRVSGFVNDSKREADDRVEINNQQNVIISAQNEIAQLIIDKLKSVIDNDNAGVNKSDLSNFAELINKMKFADETIRSKNMNEAMDKQTASTVKSKMQALANTWEPYLETLKSRAVINDIGGTGGNDSGGNGGTGIGASLDDIKTALKPTNQAIADVRNTINEVGTSLGNKLDTVNTSIAEGKHGSTSNTNKAYDKFKDDLSSIRTNIEKVVSSLAIENKTKTSQPIIMTEHLASLIKNDDGFLIPQYPKKGASTYSIGVSEASKVVEEIVAAYKDDTDTIIQKLDEALVQKIDDSQIAYDNDYESIKDLKGFVETITNAMATYDENFKQKSKFFTEKDDDGYNTRYDIYNNRESSIERLNNVVDSFEYDLKKQEALVKELDTPHSIENMIEALQNIRELGLNENYNLDDTLRSGGYEFNYRSPVSGKHEEFFLDTNYDSTEASSGVPHFLEVIDKDINFLKNLLEAQKGTDDLPNGQLQTALTNNISALDRNTDALSKLFQNGITLSRSDTPTENGDVLRQIQEIRQTLADTQTVAEAAGFVDIAKAIKNQVIPQIQSKNDYITAEKKLVDKTVTAEINRFKELAATIKNVVGEAITAKNALLETDLKHTESIVNQQMSYVRTLVSEMQNMFSVPKGLEDFSKADALIKEFGATKNITDDYRQDVTSMLGELDKLWNTGNIEEYKNKFVDLMSVLEQHQAKNRQPVNADELSYLKEEAAQLKEVLQYSEDRSNKKNPVVISQKMLNELGSNAKLLTQIYGRKGSGWRPAVNEHESTMTWEDLRNMNAEDKRYHGGSIFNDNDMEDATFFIEKANQLLEILSKIKETSRSTEIGRALGDEQSYDYAISRYEQKLNAAIGKDYNGFKDPFDAKTLEGFEEITVNAEAQQKAADQLEARLTDSGIQTTLLQMLDSLNSRFSELKGYIDNISDAAIKGAMNELATDIGAISQAIALIPEGGVPDLLANNKNNVTQFVKLQDSVQSIYTSILNNAGANVGATIGNLNVSLTPEGASSLVTQVSEAIATGEYTLRKFKVAEDTKVASKIQAVLNREEPVNVTKFLINPSKLSNLSGQISQKIAESGDISLKNFTVDPNNISQVRTDIEAKLNEKPIKLSKWETGNFKSITGLVSDGVIKGIANSVQAGLDGNNFKLKNWDVKGIQAQINTALKESPILIEDFKIGKLTEAKADIAKKIGATKIALDENNPIDIAALNVKSIKIADEVAQKIKPISVTINPTNLDDLVKQITDAFEVGTSKVIKLPNQAVYNAQRDNILKLVDQFDTAVDSADKYAGAINSITDSIKSVFEQSKPVLDELNAYVNNIVNGLHLINGTNEPAQKSSTELYYEDLIESAQNAQMRMQAGNTSVRGEEYIAAMNNEYTKLIDLLQKAKDGEGEFDSKLASDIKEQRTVIAEMEKSFKDLEKTTNEAERKLTEAEARIAQAAANNLDNPYTAEENQMLQNLRDQVLKARGEVSYDMAQEISNALIEALDQVIENVNTEGIDPDIIERLKKPVVVDYSDSEKYVKEYAESGLEVKKQLEDANSNLVKALTETQRQDLSDKYYQFANLLQKILDGDIELNADSDKEVSEKYKQIMDAFNKSIGRGGTQQAKKASGIDVVELNKLKRELEKYDTQLGKYNSNESQQYKKKISSLLQTIKKIIDGSKDITDDTSEEAVALGEDYKNLLKDADILKNGTNGNAGGLISFLDTNKTIADMDKINQRFDNLIQKIQTYVKNNSKLGSDPQMKAQFENLLVDAQSADRSTTELNRLETQLAKLKATVSDKGLTGRSLGDDMRYIAERIGIKAALGNSVYKVIGYFRQMITNVTQLDTEMTALKRVTAETEETYNKFLKNTTQNAQALGATMDQVISSTTSFVKLGYSMEDARTLANNAIIYKTVGDIDIDTATNDMISAMKAFNLEAEQSEHIVDAFDIINNEYAISAQQVGEGLRSSAAALATANNTFEESAAMVTAITEITQDAQSAGKNARKCGNTQMKVAISVKVWGQIRPRKDYIV